MNGITVSAIITTHNRLDLLKKAMKSVECQSYKNIELIVVDDNSSDGTKEFLRAYHSGLEKYINIRIDEDESKGGNYARNKGLICAVGEYVAFLDDDDEWMPEKIEKQVTFLHEKPSYGMVYCGRRAEKNFSDYKDIIQDIDFRGDLKEKCFIRIFCVTSMIMIRKDLAIQAGMFDETIKYWQEYDFCIRVAEKTLIGCIDEPLILYRIITNDKNRLSNNLAGWESAVKLINARYRDRINNYDMEVHCTNNWSGRDWHILIFEFHYILFCVVFNAWVDKLWK